MRKSKNHHERLKRNVADNPGRRRLLKALAAAGGAVGASTIRLQNWERPVIEVGLLPVHATLSACVQASGVYRLQETGRIDPGGHGSFIEQKASVVNGRRVQFTPAQPSGQPSASFKLTGQPPFVSIAGELIFSDNECTIGDCSGFGTVAGIPNVLCFVSGTLDPQSGLWMNGFYTMGANGELPGGQPFIVSFTGTREP